mmetsp:Transcript_46376/g.68467  ORF Transcript_46376/g.68467 Transcript_46376/m.68467 type:complete len:1040 (+) Transcript_46376:67-3186(+)|eukprot:CAMPEP_0195524708 /NCGR_PEP_ID=MMETSP0794_2-20130614/24710_1 /TAXON_ID=515487 /ORGANISM="Stephanopyxis turris, Strain CCMP 815" /LENGTH=1039 /DNA_ID=CAMNT_0040654985 /DNA_START=58 /DNA_END=3177 /DNA_ORIENTATION=-
MGSSIVDSPENVSVPELLEHLGVNQAEGLSSRMIQDLRNEHGWNELDKKEGKSLWELLLEQFDDALVKILLAAAAVSLALAMAEEDSGEEGVSAYVEPIVILVILILNAGVGIWQESNAESALEALKDLQPENARVLRNGEMVTITARELVPGDIVEVRVGDRVPGDMRLIEMQTTTFRVDQAQLTGESVSVQKDTEPLPSGGEDIIQAKTNILFATTVVVNGIGRAVVVQTGMQTEIGKIQQSVQEAADEDESTPLKRKLDEFGELLSKVILVICILVWVINYKNFSDPIHGGFAKGCIYYFKIAVALAVAAIPEGLPTVITTCLALGTRKMAQKNAIVRKLPSVETLGCTSVICSDKTGTLTTNEMSCVTMVLPEKSDTQTLKYNVEGISYAPIGTITPRPEFEGPSKLQFSALSLICSLCNASTIEYNGKYVRVGEPTEASLKVLIEKIGLPDSAAQKNLAARRPIDPSGTVRVVNDYWASQGKVLSTLEFSRDRKSMSVVVKPKDTARPNQLLVKGAPEGILDRCNKVLLGSGKIVELSSQGRTALLKEMEHMAGNALRCLAVAYKDLSGPLGSYDGTREHPGQAILSQPASTYKTIESDLIWVGLIGMLDPPRDEIAPMVHTCKMAGIRVIMITGDNKKTAEAIAQKVGILSSEGVHNRSFTGAQFFNLPESKQRDILSASTDGLVFSRTEPKHKQEFVKLLKQQNEIVAMTGDGVNDAPALKQADIGIAMGITGTEVAKEASDMILADDNFATIVSAVEEGRAIYNNMQAFIRYLISSNIGEVAAIFFTAALGLPEGLIPVQLLWVNLVTDGPPATALGFNPADADIMKKLPRRADDNLITGWVFFRYMIVGIYVGVACVAVFAYWYMFHESSNDGHTLISWYQLSNWSECPSWENFQVNDFDGLDMQSDPCKYFMEGKVTASTLSLSVLVTIEMLNAMNALSEDGSLVTTPPWANPYLLIAMIVSFGMHFVILYVPWLAKIFSVVPLDWNEWMVVLAFSSPVLLIDEVLKYVGRRLAAKELSKRLSEDKKYN